METHNVRMREWPPKRIPKSLSSFTPHRDGWVRWYKGRTRFVCGKCTPLEEVENAWIEVKRRADLDGSKVLTVNRFGVVTLKEAAGQYIAWLRNRMQHQKPRPLSPHTFRDYIETMEVLRVAFGAARDVATLEPSDFMRLARRFDSRAPSSLARTVAYVKAFFSWAKKAGVIADTPPYGTDFVKPSNQAKRDRRISQLKSYTPAELKALWDVAIPEDRCWIALGINCAFDNSDVSTLTREVVDLERGLIDFRRRKVGRVRRVCPLHPETLKLLKAYVRPRPATPEYESYFFLSPNGFPLVRVQPTKQDPLRSTEIDAISVRWKRLLSKSGIRGKIRVVTLPTGKTKAFYPKGDGRGFRGLRTTFANLKPHGFMEEVEIVMGHSHGSVLLENYLEEVGYDRLRELVSHVWDKAFTTAKLPDQAPKKLSTSVT